MDTRLTLRLPHFIIAGAPRTATTWLYALADRHPDVAMARPVSPEPKFFLVDELYERGLQYYSQTWFSSLPCRPCYGEKSTNYLESKATCARIARDLPEVRLIFVLRNPIERAHSNYLWSRQNGLESESFDRALELETTRELDLPTNLRYIRPHAYFSRGLYASLLRPWFQQFARARILVLRTEDVAAKPREVASTLFSFIGVPPRPDLTNDLGILNATHSDVTQALSPRAQKMLNERYLEPNAELCMLVGPSFAGWGAS